MRLYKLNDTVLNFKGNSSKLLGGLTSNSLDKPFNAFLNLHGRIIATVRQQRVSEDEYIIVTPYFVVDPLIKHLELYLKLNGTHIHESALKAYLDLDTAELLLKSQDFPSQVSEDDFILFRLEHNLPLLGVDYQPDEFILNIDEVTFVSFAKGCFLGQEPVAKVHNRSKPTRKLVVKFEDECADEENSKMTSKIMDPKRGRVKGFVFVKNN